MPGLLLGRVICPYCTKSRHPDEMLHQKAGVRLCLECQRRHEEAVEALTSGNFRGECSECGKTAEQLGEQNLQMAVHYENGKYRLICMACNLAYVPKRKELYGDTEFGRALGL